MTHRHASLRDEYGVDLRVRAIANSSTMLLEEHQIDLATWRERLDSQDIGTLPTDLDLLAGYVHTESVPHAAIIDCTASSEVALRYRDWLAQGIHVITPNKKANSGTMEYYRELQNARRADAHYFYETTVGAALPIIQTLRDLVHTGDEIHRIEGILSGTLAYLFSSFDGSTPFSQIVAAARENGYTEPDPRDDLSGMDVARKVVILAREMGMEIELSDVSIEGLDPAGLEEGSVEDFLEQLKDHDAELLKLLEGAYSQGEALRFVGTMTPTRGPPCPSAPSRQTTLSPGAGSPTTSSASTPPATTTAPSWCKAPAPDPTSPPEGSLPTFSGSPTTSARPSEG